MFLSNNLIDFLLKIFFDLISFNMVGKLFHICAPLYLIENFP